MADKNLKLSIVVAAQDLASGKLGKVKSELAGMGTAAKIGTVGLAGLVRTGNRVAGAFSTLKGRISGLAGSFGPLLGLGGIAGISALFTDSISKAEEFAATTAKLSKVIGMNAQDTSQLVDVLDKFGISGENQITLFTRLEKNALAYGTAQDKATAAIAKARKVLDSGKSTVKQRAKATEDLKKFQDQFGFSVKDSNGKIADANELLARSRDFFNSTASASQKATVLQKLYGKSWKDLIPLLSLSKQKFDEEFQTAIRLTPQQLKDAAALRGAQREFNDELGDTQTLVGLTILPNLTKLVRTAKSFLTNNRANIIGAVQGAIALAGQIGNAFGAVVKGLSTAWNAIPGPLRDLLVKGFIANRTIKFLFGFDPAKMAVGAIGSVITKGLGGLLSRGGSPAAPMYTKEVGVGGAGGTGVAGGGKLGTVLGAVAIVGEALAVWQTWTSQNEQSTKQANDLAKQQNDWLKKGASRNDIVNGLAAVDQGIAAIRNNPLLTLVQGEALNRLESMDSQLRQQLAHMAAQTATGKQIISAVTNLGPKFGQTFNSGGIIGAVLALIPHIDNINLRVNGGGRSRVGGGEQNRGKGSGYVDKGGGRGGGRATGGPVKEGVAYTVGEHGPETFVPGKSGTIVPHKGKATPKKEGLPVFVTNWPSGSGVGGSTDALNAAAEKWRLTRVRRGSPQWSKLMAEAAAQSIHIYVKPADVSAREVHRADTNWRRVTSANGSGVSIR